MSDQNKIYNLYEGLNQSAIAYDQQRNKQSYKYTPKQSSVSYNKYDLPTTSSVKANGPGFVANGISDEEILIKGFGSMRADQVDGMLDNVKADILNLIDRNATGNILLAKIDLYTSLVKALDNEGY